MDLTGTLGGGDSNRKFLMRGDILLLWFISDSFELDGSRKASFTAPSVTGQSEVITKAFRQAKIHPEDISYVEALGTAMKVGDIIELQ